MEFRRVLRSKIHRATVTQANLAYEGSITIPPELLKAADIAPYEAVQVWNVTNGERLETYAIPGRPGSGDICINGAAAHRASRGDLVIIACFGFVEQEKLCRHEPRLIFVDAQNKVREVRAEIPGPFTVV